MPRIAGINLVGVLVATLIFYFIGFLFYGVIFQRDWTVEILTMRDPQSAATIAQMSQERLVEHWNKIFPGASANAGLSMGLGFLNALVTVSFLAIILRQLSAVAPERMPQLLHTLAIVVGFVVTSLAYDQIYALAPVKLLIIDAGHLTCAYLAAAFTLSFFD